jgi:WD40 repeat protein
MRWPVVIAVIATNIVLVAALVLIFRDRDDGTTDDEGAGPPLTLVDHAADAEFGEQIGDPLDAHQGRVVAMQAVDAHGTTVLFSTDDAEAAVRKWDLESGRETGNHRFEHPIILMRELEFSDGAKRIAAVDSEASVFVWDAEDFDPDQVRDGTGVDDTIRFLGLMHHDGIPVLTATSFTGFAVYDLEQREAVSLCAFDGEVDLSLDHTRIVEIDGSAVVVAAFDDGWLRRYDAVACAIIGEDFGGPESGSWTEDRTVERLDHVDAENGAVAMVFDGEAHHRWDIATGDPVGEPILDASESEFCRNTAAIGGQEAVLAVGEGRVMAAELLSGSDVGTVGEGTDVTGVEVVRIGAYTLAVTGHEDGTVRLWSLGH